MRDRGNMKGRGQEMVGEVQKRRPKGCKEEQMSQQRVKMVTVPHAVHTF